MKSVLDVEVSCFANYIEASQPKVVSLLAWLTSSQHKAKVDAIRATTDKKVRDRIKATLPAITPSGLFTRRHNTALIKHSGLVCLDIDPKGNEGISNYPDLKHEICQIKNVAYCGLSVSGTGFFVLIPITHSEHHREHFNALRELFQKRYMIRVDSTPDVSRLRGYSFDEDGYFNHHARPFGGIYQPQPKPLPERQKRAYSHLLGSLEETILTRCVRLVIDAPDGEKHDCLLKAARLAGGYIGSGIVAQNTAIGTLEDAISQRANVADFKAAQRTIQDGINYGMGSPIYPDTTTETTLDKVQSNTRPYMILDSVKYYGHILPEISTSTNPIIKDANSPTEPPTLTTSTNKPLAEVLARCLNTPVDAVPLYQLTNP